MDAFLALYCENDSPPRYHCKVSQYTEQMDNTRLSSSKKASQVAAEAGLELVVVVERVEKVVVVVVVVAMVAKEAMEGL